MAEPLADCPANLRLSTFGIDLPGWVGGPRLEPREDVTYDLP
jgi:hypothetical protein